MKLNIFLDDDSTSISFNDTKLPEMDLKKIVYLAGVSKWMSDISTDSISEATIDELLKFNFDIVDQRDELSSPVSKIDYKWGE